MNEKFTSGINPNILTSEKPEPPQSRIQPCAIGINAPPTIAITNPAEPIFASSPISFKAMP